MRASIAALLEAARGLRLARHDNAHGVRIGARPEELPARLVELLGAIEAVDAEGGRQSVLDADPALLAEGIDGVFRWIAAQGLATDEPLAILARAVGRGGKRQAKPVPLPRFDPKFTPRKGWKPRLTLAREIGSALASLDAGPGNRLASAMDETARLMGAAMARPEPPRPGR